MKTNEINVIFRNFVGEYYYRTMHLISRSKKSAIVRSENGAEYTVPLSDISTEAQLDPENLIRRLNGLQEKKDG